MCSCQSANCGTFQQDLRCAQCQISSPSVSKYSMCALQKVEFVSSQERYLRIQTTQVHTKNQLHLIPYPYVFCLQSVYIPGSFFTQQFIAQTWKDQASERSERKLCHDLQTGVFVSFLVFLEQLMCCYKRIYVFSWKIY